VSVGSVAILSLGSNLGDREAIIRDAVRAIGEIEGVALLAASGFVQTPALKPEGVDEEAPAYLNVALSVRTELTPDLLLDALNEIEREHGRVRLVRWGDRTLDIDIIVFDDLVRADDRLTLPHPRASERAFVLAPWLQVDPDAEIPGRGRADALLAATGEDVQAYEAEALL